GFFDIVFMLLMLFVLGIIVFLVPLLAYYTMKKKHLSIKKTRKKLYQQMTDAAFGQLDSVVSGRVNEAEAAMQVENAKMMKKETSMHCWQHMRDAYPRCIVGFVIILMMYWTNIQVGNETITATLIAAFVLMMFSVTDALLPVSDAVEEI